MELLSIQKITLVFNIATGLWLAFWIYLKGAKKKSIRLFSFFVIFIILWSLFSYLADVTKNIDLALLYRRLVFGVVSVLFIITYYFAKYFPEEDERVKYPVLDVIINVFGVSFFFISLFTDWLIKDVKFESWGTEIIKGRLTDIWFYSLIPLTLLVIFLLFKKYFYLSKEDRTKVKYFLVGITIFAAINLIFNVFTVIYYGTYKYHNLGDASLVILLGFTIYAIVEKKFFGVKPILVQLLVGFTGVMLLLAPFMIESPTVKVMHYAFFFLFCVVGYLLINYTSQEAKQKEILEEMAKERTKELQKTYDEIKERNEELEKLYKLTIGTEQRLTELKKIVDEKETENKKLREGLKK